MPGSKTTRPKIGNMGLLFPKNLSESNLPPSVILEQAASLDYASGVSWSERRWKELEQIEGSSYLPQQYGMKVTKHETPFFEQKGGPRLYNKWSSSYYRNVTIPGFINACQALYEQSKQEDDPPVSRVAFFHSKSAARRLSQVMILQADPSTKVLGKGLVAAMLGSRKHHAAILRDTSEVWGARPSLYGVRKHYEVMMIKKSHPDAPLMPVPDPNLDNCATLKTILAWQHNGPLKDLAALPKEHPQKEVADTAVALVAGLNTVLERRGDCPTFKHNPLIGNNLNKLATSLPYMLEAARKKDEVQFFAGYRVMIEENNMALVSSRPYSPEDFQIAAVEKFHTRSGNALKNKPGIFGPRPYLFATFTDGTRTAHHVVQHVTGIRSFQYLSDLETLPDYFETKEVNGEGVQRDGASEGVFFAILNPSTPRQRHALDTTNDWNVHKLIYELDKRLKGVRGSGTSCLFLILDATIEKGLGDNNGATDLRTFCEAMAPHFKNERLVALMNKSLEKIDGLYTNRFAAGELELIGGDNEITRKIAEELDKFHQDVDLAANDESQLLMHGMTHAHHHAQKMYDKSAQNNTFIHQHILGATKRPGFDLYEPGLSMGVIINHKKRRATFQLGKNKTHGALTFLHAPTFDLLLSELDHNLSFGFFETTFVEIDDDQHIRISSGQESQELLSEKLYAFGWVFNNQNRELGSIRVDTMVKETERLIKDALIPVLEHTEVESWCDTALEVLKERTVRKESELEYSLDELRKSSNSLKQLHSQMTRLPQFAPSQFQNKPLSEKRQKLRKELIETLEHTRGEGEISLVEDLKLLASASASTSQESIFTEMPPEDDKGIAARYALNRAVSMLALAGFVFSHAVDLPDEDEQSEDESRQVGLDKESKRKLDATFRAFMDAGLPRVTPLYRARVIERWLWLNQKTFEHPEQLPALANDIIKYASLLPWPGEKAKILANFPEEAFDRLQKDENTALVDTLLDTLFGSLDFVSQCAFAKRLIKQEHDKKADACLNFLFEKVEAMSDEQFESLRQTLIDRYDKAEYKSALTNAVGRKAFVEEVMLNEIVRLPSDTRPRLPADAIRVMVRRPKHQLEAQDSSDGLTSELDESEPELDELSESDE